MKKRFITLAAVFAVCAAAMFANPEFRVVVTKNNTPVRSTAIPFNVVTYANAGDSYEYMTQYYFFYSAEALDGSGLYFINKNNATVMSTEDYEAQYGSN